MLFLIVYAKILQLNETTYLPTIQQYPYVLVEFYSKSCQVCQQLQPELNKVSQIVADPNNQIASALIISQVEASKNQKLIKAFHITKFPTFYFYRLSSREEYFGPKDSKGMLQWLYSNLRPLIHKFETIIDLKEFVETRVALVYFIKEDEIPNQEVINEMERIARKYQKIYMVQTLQPQLREEFNIPEQISLVLYPQNREPTHYEGFIVGIEQYILEQGFPLIFSATSAEMEIIKIEQIPLVASIQTEIQKFEKIAQKYINKVRFCFLSPNDLGGILYFQDYILKEEFDLDYFYFITSKQKVMKFVSLNELQSAIYEYYDKHNL